MTDLMATAGAQTRAAGEHGGIRMNRESGLYIAPVSARYQEAVLRGNVFTVTNQTGVVSQAGLSATTPVLTLQNPVGSTHNLVLWYAAAAFDEVFATAGAVWLAAGAGGVTGTLSTITKNALLGSNNNPKAEVFLAATLPAAPIAIDLLGMGFTGAITTIPYIQSLEKWYDGAIILGPNTNVSIQTGVASGTAGTFLQYIWEEIAI